MSKINMAFVVEQYPPTGGGMATSAQRISRHLSQLGVNVIIISFDYFIPIESEDIVRKENDLKVDVYRIAPFFISQSTEEISISESLKAKLRRRAFNQITNLLYDKAISCVLAFPLINAGYMGLLISRELKVPFIVGVRGNDIGKSIFHTERLPIIQWIINGANKIVCVNQYLCSRLLLAFPDVENKTSVIPNGTTPYKVDKKKYKKKLLELTNWNETDLILAFSGTLREKKGVIPLLKALDICNNNAIKLLIIGPEIELEAKTTCQPILDKLIERNSVYVTGNVNRNVVKNWMVSGDIVIMPSIDDGMANGLLEGMALGLCPLVSSVFLDIVKHEVNGIVVAANDSLNLSRSITQLFNNRSLILKYGAEALKSIKSYHQPKQESKKYLELIKSLTM